MHGADKCYFKSAYYHCVQLLPFIVVLVSIKGASW